LPERCDARLQLHELSPDRFIVRFLRKLVGVERCVAFVDVGHGSDDIPFVLVDRVEVRKNVIESQVFDFAPTFDGKSVVISE
jgi:hypothetical protein